MGKTVGVFKLAMKFSFYINNLLAIHYWAKYHYFIIKRNFTTGISFFA